MEAGINTLIFDLGRVIVNFTYERAFDRVQALTGLTHEEIRARLFAGTLAADFETGRMQPEAFAEEVNRRLGTALAMGEFGELWSSIFHPEPLIPEARLRELAGRRRLVLLSNTNPLHFEMIRRTYAHIGHFHALVLSHEVGAMKPDRAIYDAAIAAAGCSAQCCLFFDDLPENVEAARAAGLKACQFTGLEQLELDLARHGVS